MLKTFRFALLMACQLALLGGCNNVFFQPNSLLYYQPHQFGLWHEEVKFTSADGTLLTGWFLPGRKPVRATIVHFHGNAANISNHLLAMQWLPPKGYSVLLFDYRGFGLSQGSPSRLGAIEDGAAAIEYVRGRKDVDPNRLFVYGQSLGGALAFNALARAGTKGVLALVVEGTFQSYREVVRLIMDDTWALWAFQYPVSWLLFSDTDSPIDVFDQLAHVPLLVVHGEKDTTVPLEAGRRLADAFPGANKAFWPIPYAKHQQIFTPKGSPWRENLLQYFEKKLKEQDRRDEALLRAKAERQKRPALGPDCRWVVEKLPGWRPRGVMRCDKPQ